MYVTKDIIRICKLLYIKNKKTTQCKEEREDGGRERGGGGRRRKRRREGKNWTGTSQRIVYKWPISKKSVQHH